MSLRVARGRGAAAWRRLDDAPGIACGAAPNSAPSSCNADPSHFPDRLLVFCPRDTVTKSGDFFEDRVCGCGPDERSSIGIVMSDEAVDFANEVDDGDEGAAADGALGDQGEEALDLVEPGSVGRGEVKMPARPPCEPRPDLGVLMGGVVVDDEMDVEGDRDVGLD